MPIILAAKDLYGKREVGLRCGVPISWRITNMIVHEINLESRRVCGNRLSIQRWPFDLRHSLGLCKSAVLVLDKFHQDSLEYMQMRLIYRSSLIYHSQETPADHIITHTECQNDALFVSWLALATLRVVLFFSGRCWLLFCIHFTGVLLDCHLYLPDTQGVKYPVNSKNRCCWVTQFSLPRQKSFCCSGWNFLFHPDSAIHYIKVINGMQSLWLSQVRFTWGGVGVCLSPPCVMSKAGTHGKIQTLKFTVYTITKSAIFFRILLSFRRRKVARSAWKEQVSIKDRSCLCALKVLQSSLPEIEVRVDA